MKPRSYNKIDYLRLRYLREYKGPRRLYLSAIPEYRQKGWLWDWLAEWGRTIKRGRHERPMKLVEHLTMGRRIPHIGYAHLIPEHRLGGWLSSEGDPDFR